MIYPDLAIFDKAFEGAKALTVAGSNDTIPAVQGEQGTVGRTLDVLFLRVQKLIRLPLKPNSPVRALVDKCANTILLSNNKDRQFAKLEAASARVIQFIKVTQFVVHRGSPTKGLRLTRGALCV